MREDGNRRAAKALARDSGTALPALTGDYRSIRGAEKILEDGEDWRVLGTNEDPVVQEALQAAEEGGLS